MFSFFLRSRCCARTTIPWTPTTSMIVASTSVITTTSSISSFSFPTQQQNTSLLFQQQQPIFQNTTSSQFSVAAASTPALWMATRFARTTSSTIKAKDAKIKQLEKDKKELKRQLDEALDKIKVIEQQRKKNQRMERQACKRANESIAHFFKLRALRRKEMKPEEINKPEEIFKSPLHH